MKSNIISYFNKNTSGAPLAIFRIVFGLMMLASIVRFWALGWIDKLYIQPSFFFSYYGFEWVKPIGQFTYLIFIICGISAVLVIIGYKYRMSILVFFLSFLYIELMDKTTYLNHYYFISTLAFLLIFLPAGKYFSIDSYRNNSFFTSPIRQWHLDAIKLLLAIVYFYAGLAKLNSDWLFEAMPLRIWLPTLTDLPIIGSVLDNKTMIYVFSWAGACYDLTIPFLLFKKQTRIPAFCVVVIFHILTAVMFPIGMFPYLMIGCALIFFDSSFHLKLINGILKALNISTKSQIPQVAASGSSFRSKASISLVTIFFILQLIIPFRHLLYPQELFWSEEGYRFSWRVMLMEKAGYAQFKISNKETGKAFYVDNSDFLTPFQEKQMSTQPDFILEYAHYLAHHFSSQGHQNIGVFVDSFVALNGRRSTRFIDSTMDLTQFEESFAHKTWVLPFNDEIIGL